MLRRNQKGIKIVFLRIDDPISSTELQLASEELLLSYTGMSEIRISLIVLVSLIYF